MEDLRALVGGYFQSRCVYSNLQPLCTSMMWKATFWSLLPNSELGGGVVSLANCLRYIDQHQYMKTLRENECVAIKRQQFMFYRYTREHCHSAYVSYVVKCLEMEVSSKMFKKETTHPAATFE